MPDEPKKPEDEQQRVHIGDVTDSVFTVGQSGGIAAREIHVGRVNVRGRALFRNEPLPDGGFRSRAALDITGSPNELLIMVESPTLRSMELKPQASMVTEGMSRRWGQKAGTTLYNPPACVWVDWITESEDKGTQVTWDYPE